MSRSADVNSARLIFIAGISELDPETAVIQCCWTNGVVNRSPIENTYAVERVAGIIGVPVQSRRSNYRPAVPSVMPRSHSAEQRY